MYVLENNVAWTDELKNAFKHGITRASIIYDNITINENNNLSNLTLTEQRYISGIGFIGTATAKKLEINITDTENSINLEDKELTLKIGADYNNSTYYINYGNFIVDSAPVHDETNGKTKIVAYDYMIKFNKPYEDQVNYPCTLLQLLQNICTQAGVTLETTDFANKDFLVQDNQFEGATLREVLQNIAKCAFSWARIGQDNKLYLDFATKPMVLPAGYTELEYIKGDGASYIDTDIASTSDINFEGKFSVGENFSGYYLGAEELSGYTLKGIALSKTGLKINGALTQITPPTADVEFTIKKDENTLTYDSNDYTLSTFTDSLKFYLLCNNYRGTASYFGNDVKLYNFKMYNGTTLVRNFIPCKNPDGEVGLYDLVSETFFENQGTGNFTAGDTINEAETLTIDDYKANAFKKANEYYGPVNRVVYADSDIEGQEEEVHDAASILENGLKELTIYDNLFAYTPEKRQALIQAGTRLFGLKYMPVTQLDSIGFIYLDCNDIINIETLDETIYQTRPFNHIIRYSGAISDSITAEGVSNNEQTYKNTANDIYQAQAAKIAVDRANKKILQLVSQTTENSNQITQMLLDIDGIQTEVSGVYDLTRAVTGTRQITLEECLNGYILEIHIKGNNYVFAEDSNITVTDSSNNVTTYDLGVNGVLRANSEVYDEYILKDNAAKVIRRVNSDGTTKITEVVEDLGEMIIYVAEGDNVIRITNYYADMSVKYIPKNNYTEQFVPTLELGTQIIQNQNSVKIAWNQISQAIQMMAVNNNASLAIVDENGKILSYFDKTGQHFLQPDQSILADMGVKQVTEYDQQGQEQTLNYIAFSVPVSYGSYTRQGMAWGVETPDGKFYPVMFVRNFYMAQQQAGDFGGQVELNNCDLVIGATSGITNNSIKISGEPTGELTFTSEVNNPTNLLTLYPEGHYEEQYGALKLLDKISFYKNMSGTNTFKVGVGNQYSLLSSDGYLSTTGDASIGGQLYIKGDGSYGFIAYHDCRIYNGGLNVDGNVYAANIGSDRRIKKDIEDCNVSALEKIMKIQHKQFTKTTDNKHYDIGYIAQDMEEIDSNFVLIDEKDKDKPYYINELPIIATLTKAIQEQQKQIDELKKEVQKLKGGA